ncbi:MAG: FixG Ig-like domain-containing protein, partial [Pseudomonadota bacterium]
RPRTIAYSLILLAVAGVMVFGLVARDSMEVTVIRDRNPLFVTLSDGSIRNGYQIRLLNKKREPVGVTLSVEGLEGALLSVVGQSDGGPIVLDAPADGVATYIAHVAAPASALAGPENTLEFIATDAAGERFVRADIFRGPER